MAASNFWILSFLGRRAWVLLLALSAHSFLSIQCKSVQQINSNDEDDGGDEHHGRNMAKEDAMGCYYYPTECGLDKFHRQNQLPPSKNPIQEPLKQTKAKRWRNFKSNARGDFEANLIPLHAKEDAWKQAHASPHTSSTSAEDAQRTAVFSSLLMEQLTNNLHNLLSKKS